MRLRIGFQAGMEFEANKNVKQGGQGSVEFDDSAEVGSVENRLSAVRTLVEDLAHSGESRYEKQITVDGRIWRVVAEEI